MTHDSPEMTKYKIFAKILGILALVFFGIISKLNVVI